MKFGAKKTSSGNQTFLLAYLQAAILNCVSGPFFTRKTKYTASHMRRTCEMSGFLGFFHSSSEPTIGKYEAGPPWARDCSTYNVHLNGQRVIRLFFRTLWKGAFVAQLSLVAQFPTNGFSIFLDTKLVIRPQKVRYGHNFPCEKVSAKKIHFWCKRSLYVTMFLMMSVFSPCTAGRDCILRLQTKHALFTSENKV